MSRRQKAALRAALVEADCERGAALLRDRRVLCFAPLSIIPTAFNVLPVCPCLKLACHRLSAPKCAEKVSKMREKKCERRAATAGVGLSRANHEKKNEMKRRKKKENEGWSGRRQREHREREK
jgi:hypothetical protein